MTRRTVSAFWNALLRVRRRSMTTASATMLSTVPAKIDLSVMLGRVSRRLIGNAAKMRSIA